MTNHALSPHKSSYAFLVFSYMIFFLFLLLLFLICLNNVFSIQQRVEKKSLISVISEITCLWSSLFWMENLSLIWEKLVIFFALLVSNFTLHWLDDCVPNSQRYVILKDLLVSRNISSNKWSDQSESLFQYKFFHSFHCFFNNWIVIYFNYNVCLCYHSIKHCTKTSQI